MFKGMVGTGLCAILSTMFARAMAELSKFMEMQLTGASLEHDVHPSICRRFKHGVKRCVSGSLGF